MSALTQYRHLVTMALRENRDEFAFITILQAMMTLGFVVGFGYIINDISERQALFLTTGSATNTLVTIAVVGLSQVLATAKAEGRLHYMLTLPVSREVYLAAQVTYVGLTAIPGVAFALVLGAWHYDLSLAIDPAVLAVIPLVVVCMAGVGVAVGVLLPNPNLVNALANLSLFYILLFAPILIPPDQLPALLRHLSVVLPTTYAADAMRGVFTDLPGTHLARSMLLLAGFSAISLGASAASIRRRE